MRYSHKINPDEWVVFYYPNCDIIAIAPKRKSKFYDFAGWYLIGDL